MSLYLLSDTHFEHSNIIKYCDRPFDSCSKMNKAMVNNWNSKVSYNDDVLFCGDLAMSGVDTVRNLSRKLNGNMTLLVGNHDDFSREQVPFTVLKSTYFSHEYDGKKYEFYCSHWPPRYQEITNRTDSRCEPKYSNPPEWFDGWRIHGHVHNNDTKEFPFVNHTRKTVNIGVELTGYTPIGIDELIEILQQGRWYESVEEVPNHIYSL